MLAEAYTTARKLAADETGVKLSRFPKECAWDIDELLTEAQTLPQKRAKSRLNRVGKTARLAGKKLRGAVKAGRGKVSFD